MQRINNLRRSLHTYPWIRRNGEARDEFNVGFNNGFLPRHVRFIVIITESLSKMIIHLKVGPTVQASEEV